MGFRKHISNDITIKPIMDEATFLESYLSSASDQQNPMNNKANFTNKNKGFQHNILFHKASSYLDSASSGYSMLEEMTSQFSINLTVGMNISGKLAAPSALYSN
jgi:hypothetical protein